MAAQTKIAEPTVVNGINIDELFALIEGVRRDAAKGKTNWRVTTTWQGQTRSRAQVEAFEIGGERVPRQFAIDIDEPCELGGTNRFANPQEHLLAALNACMMVGYAAQCAVRGITLESLEIETDGEIDLRGFLGIDPAVPPGYENLRYVVRIRGSGTREEFAEIHEPLISKSWTRTGSRLALAAQLLTAVLEVAHQFLFLRVDRDRRLAGGEVRPSLRWH